MNKGLSIKPNHFKQYKDIAFLLLRFGHGPGSKIMKMLNAKNEPLPNAPPIDGLAPPGSAGASYDLANLVADIEKMGPTFIRLGQLLAMRPNLLPLPYLDALSSLGKHCEPIAYTAVVQTIEAELGRDLNSVFLSIDQQPISVSVLEQTHQAVLINKSKVVVKIQRPGLTDQLYDDLQALDEVASLFDQYSAESDEFDFHEALQVFRRTIISELDYRQEAHNLRTLRNYLKHLDHIVLPEPIETYSTSKILVLAYINGDKLPEAKRLNGLLKSERNKLAEQVFHAYMQQFLQDGFVHLDPDPDNMILTREGKIAILDLGVVDRITPAMQAKLIQLLLSINEGRADQSAELLVAMCTRRKSFNEIEFRRVVADLVLAHRDGGMEETEIGQLFRGIAQASAKCGATLPWEVSELGTAFAKLDAVACLLDPNFDTNGFLRKEVSQIMRKHMSSALSPAHIFHTVVETSEFFEELPKKVSKILDAVANNDLKMTVHAIDEKVLVNGFQKIANRITVGIVLAALIMGASMLMRVQTSFTIFGYPGLAIICFIAAAGGGFFLVLEILISDHNSKCDS